MSAPPDVPSQILDRLFEVIERRQDERPAGNATSSACSTGIPAISAKVIEEADEVVRAAAAESDAALAREVADLFFHVLVLMAARGVAPGATYAELARRFGIGGLVEKAARAASGAAGPTRDGK
ncbi:MAG: phosphoribosyl-ATP diphosphatase [Myxococcota bacterium]